MKILHSEVNLIIYKACKLSNETDFVFAKVFISFFKHQCSLLQNSSLGQLHTDADVPTFSSSTGSLQPVLSSVCPLQSKKKKKF